MQKQPEKEGYAGLHETISLYPVDSAYGDEQLAVALLIPDEKLLCRSLMLIR